MLPKQALRDYGNASHAFPKYMVSLIIPYWDKPVSGQRKPEIKYCESSDRVLNRNPLKWNLIYCDIIDIYASIGKCKLSSGVSCGAWKIKAQEWNKRWQLPEREIRDC